jgi:hypothetical protein
MPDCYLPLLLLNKQFFNARYDPEAIKSLHSFPRRLLPMMMMMIIGITD